MLRCLSSLATLVLVACADGPELVEASFEPDAPAAVEAPVSPAPAAPVVTSFVPRADDVGALGERVDSIVERWIGEASRRTAGQATARNVHVAVYAIDAERGTVFAEREASRSLTPASNLKLATTAAAMVALGPTGEIVTRFTSTGRVVQSTLTGDLVVHGAGDPLWHPEGRGGERLDGVLERLASAGIRRIEGDVVLDTGTFEPPAAGPEWPSANQHWDDYCALAGAFSVHGGVLRAVVRPRENGRAADVEVAPWPTGLDARINVLTKAGARLRVNVGATATRLTVTGELPPSERPYVAEFRHPDPIALFANVLLDRMKRVGIELTGSVLRDSGRPEGRVLAELRSPVRDLLAPINADSVNGVADQLFFALGARIAGDGSRAGAARAVGKLLLRLGVSADGWNQVDGSGLSRANRVTARQLAMILVAVLQRDPETAELYRDSLALAGRRGTLEGRMRGGPAEGRAWGKTGWIRGVSALSGITTTTRGRDIVFSILVEYPPGLGGLNTHVFKPMQDELVELFVETP
ncbi:MAG: D-alanyl-D-alanine carboxypeptidase/D-alanyl-D-alanine-endopeptidase [Planctomycetota bacterium]